MFDRLPEIFATEHLQGALKNHCGAPSVHEI